jgi:hypothetical protein
MKLFMFCVGGNCGNSNVELHDVRFWVGETPQDCYVCAPRITGVNGNEIRSEVNYLAFRTSGMTSLKYSTSAATST